MGTFENKLNTLATTIVNKAGGSGKKTLDQLNTLVSDLNQVISTSNSTTPNDMDALMVSANEGIYYLYNGTSGTSTSGNYYYNGNIYTYVEFTGYDITIVQDWTINYHSRDTEVYYKVNSNTCSSSDYDGYVCYSGMEIYGTTSFSNAKTITIYTAYPEDYDDTNTHIININGENKTASSLGMSSTVKTATINITSSQTITIMAMADD